MEVGKVDSFWWRLATDTLASVFETVGIRSKIFHEPGRLQELNSGVWSLKYIRDTFF